MANTACVVQPCCWRGPKIGSVAAPAVTTAPQRGFVLSYKLSVPHHVALRAAKQIERNPSFNQSTAEIIDRETGAREVLEILESIIAEAGDLIEGRSPELVAAARAALRRYSDEVPRQAE